MPLLVVVVVVVVVVFSGGLAPGLRRTVPETPNHDMEWRGPGGDTCACETAPVWAVRDPVLPATVVPSACYYYHCYYYHSSAVLCTMDACI